MDHKSNEGDVVALRVPEIDYFRWLYVYVIFSHEIRAAFVNGLREALYSSGQYITFLDICYPKKFILTDFYGFNYTRYFSVIKPVGLRGILPQLNRAAGILKKCGALSAYCLRTTEYI